MKKVFLADMHTHSESSHDSVCSLTERIKEVQNGTCDIFAVTDHCDIPTYKEQSFFGYKGLFYPHIVLEVFQVQVSFAP